MVFDFGVYEKRRIVTFFLMIYLILPGLVKAGSLTNYIDENSDRLRADISLISTMMYRSRWHDVSWGLNRLAIKIAASSPEGLWMENESKKRLEEEAESSIRTMKAYLKHSRLSSAAREAEQWIGREIELMDNLKPDIGGRLWGTIAEVLLKKQDGRSENAAKMAELFQSSEKPGNWGWQGELERMPEPEERFRLVEQELYGHILARENRILEHLSELKARLESSNDLYTPQGDPLKVAVSLFWSKGGFLHALYINSIQNDIAGSMRTGDYKSVMNRVLELGLYDDENQIITYLSVLLLSYNNLWVHIPSFGNDVDNMAISLTGAMDRNTSSFFRLMVGMGDFAVGNYENGVKQIRRGVLEGREYNPVQSFLDALYSAIKSRSNIDRKIFDRMTGYRAEESTVTIRDLEKRFPGGIQLLRGDMQVLKRKILLPEINEIIKTVAGKNYKIPEIIFSEKSSDQDQEADEKPVSQPVANKTVIEKGPPISISQFLFYAVIAVILLVLWIYLSQFEFSFWRKSVSKQQVFAKAKALMDAKQFKQAQDKLSALENMTLFDDEEAEFDMMMAHCFRGLKDNMEALVSCKKALKAKKRDDALRLMGEIYFESEEFSPNSVETFEFLEKTDSSRREWTQALGKTYRNIRKYDEVSLRIFKNLQKLNPEDFENRKDIGRCLIEMKNKDKSTEDFLLNLRKQAPEDIEIRTMWCRLLQNSGRLEDLATESYEALLIDPDNISFHLMYRDSLRKLERLEVLEKSYKKLCERFPKSLRMKEKYKEAQNMRIAMGTSGAGVEINIDQPSGNGNLCEKCGNIAAFSDLLCGKCGNPLG